MRKSSETGLEADRNDQRHIDNIVSYAKNYKLTSQELVDAYQLALGMSASTDKPRAEVVEMASILDQAMSEGLPVNKITELIGTKGVAEQLPDKFFRMVDDMPISHAERSVLKSILDKRKPGLLSVVDSKTNQTLGEVAVPAEINNQNYPREMIAAELMNFLLRFAQAENIGIQFEEA